MHHMRAEILEQPDVIAALLAREQASIRALADACRQRQITFLSIAARGTSDHAAIFARYFFEMVTGVPAALAAPSIFTLYRRPPRLERALVLGISQSGEAEDATEVLRQARAQGALTACIVNHAASSMAAVAEHTLLCHAGEELSLPATKTYTASLALAYALAATIAERTDLLGHLEAVPGWMRQVLASEAEIQRRAERYRYMEECVVLARGLNQCTALETALKLMETNYLRALGYSAADFLHGHIAIVEEGYPCIAYAPGGAAYPGMLALLERLRSQGAERIVVSDREEALALAQTPFPIPSVPEEVSPLVAILIGQLFTYHLALVKGRDPDHPRGLKKVTRTR
ncbi:MAG: SIS domain-containing protein [Armatimonadetes bacterium]|nr:SIS domain-containing protein [Armatimonadota bacterium]